MGVVPDRPFLYEKLTGREFLRFLGGLYRVPAAHVDAAAGELLRLFRLEAWADELIEGYSHGMKQRVIMAGSLIHDPQVMVVDEPMVGLDPQGARLLKDVLTGFAARGRTVFLSTHSLPVAEELCDRIGILSRGKLVALGTMDELRARASHSGDLESVFLTLTREAHDEYSGEEASADEILQAVLRERSQVDKLLDPEPDEGEELEERDTEPTLVAEPVEAEDEDPAPEPDVQKPVAGAERE
jgi:ABC-2 type transport system ATP-binding protein